MNTIESLSNVTVQFALALALALLIERFLEVLKSAYDLIDSRNDLYTYWTRKTYAIRDLAERKLRVFGYVAPEQAAPVLQRFSEMLLNGRPGYSGTVPILSGDLVRALYIKIYAKAVGIATGIALAYALDIDFINLWQMKDAGGTTALSHYFFTGTAIGLGSGPVHNIIRAIETRREKLSAKGGA